MDAFVLSVHHRLLVFSVLALAFLLISQKGRASISGVGVIIDNTITETNQVKSNVISIGAIVDYGTRIGKEEKVAMEMAIEDFNNNNHSSTSTNQSLILKLEVKDSRGEPIEAARAGIYLSV